MGPIDMDDDDESVLPLRRPPPARPFRPAHLPEIEVAVIVDGGQDFTDTERIGRALAASQARSGWNTLRHRGQPGAHQLAGRWSLAQPRLWQTVHADWGDAVALGAVGCIALPGADPALVDRCAAAGIPVWRPYG